MIVVTILDHASELAFEEDHDVIRAALQTWIAIGGEGVWQGLLDTAELRQGDDARCDGYLVIAEMRDLETWRTDDRRIWLGLCQDQKVRAAEYVRELGDSSPSI